MSEQTTKVDDGGPAFARAGDAYSQSDHSEGMSLRDYFAAKAMTALIDGYDYEAREKSREVGSVADRTGFDDNPHPDSEATYASQCADEAYIIADAMLKARGR